MLKLITNEVNKPLVATTRNKGNSIKNYLYFVYFPLFSMIGFEAINMLFFLIDFNFSVAKNSKCSTFLISFFPISICFSVIPILNKYVLISSRLASQKNLYAL